MRQVNEDELVWKLRFQLGRLSATMRAGLASRNTEVRRDTEHRIALHLARQALKRLEILSDAPLGLYGDDLYSRAAHGEGRLMIDEPDDVLKDQGQ